MLIIIKGSNNLYFNRFEEFEEWVVSLIPNIKDGHLSDNLEINTYYHENKSVSGIKKLRSDVKEFFYNKTILNSKYWITRGWDPHEAVEKIRTEQKRRSFLSSKKSKEMKEKNYEMWAETKNTHLEFYIKKGFSYEDAKIKLTERQKTFSKEVCIDKYGEADGIKIWQDRQTKWIESLYETYKKEHYPEKDSSSLNTLNINECVFRNFYKNCEFINDAIVYSNDDIDKFIDYIYQNKNIYSLLELSYIFNSKILQEFFKTNQTEFKIKIIKKYGVIPGKFGNIRYFNDHICRSNGEYFISKQLNKLGIDYIYEKKYPNSNFVCDFYIKDINVYVEYMGFLKSDYMHKHNKKICKDYIDKYDIKKQMCVDNNLNFIYDNDYKLIINKIKEQYNDTRK